MTGLFRCASSPCKICWRKPAYCRPPFCGGSNGFLAGSYPHPCAEIKNRPLGDVLFLGRMTGFEPATFGTTNQRSNQLSYIRHTEIWWS